MSLDVTAGGAFVAGLLSFASPCVLPLVPPYLAYMGGRSSSCASRAVRGARAAGGAVLCRRFSTVFGRWAPRRPGWGGDRRPTRLPSYVAGMRSC